MAGKGRLVSPNEMMKAGKDIMLEGREPANHIDWMMLVNFMAVNIDQEAAIPAIKLMKHLYDIPVTEAEIEETVKFQIGRKVNAVPVSL